MSTKPIDEIVDVNEEGSVIGEEEKGQSPVFASKSASSILQSTNAGGSPVCDDIFCDMKTVEGEIENRAVHDKQQQGLHDTRKTG